MGASGDVTALAARNHRSSQIVPTVQEAAIGDVEPSPLWAFPVWLGLVVAASFIAVETVVVLLLKQVAPGSAFGVVYLVGVLVVSTVWGFGLAAMMTVVSIFLVVALVANTLAQLAGTRAIEAEHSRDGLRVLADLQASLRRVATLVARGGDPVAVFATVADELARCLGVHHAT